MSFENEETDVQGEYEWRETYFILFKAGNRPTLTQVEHAIGRLSNRLQFEYLKADEDGRFESMMVRSPDDYAAVEVSYETGDAVIEQASDLAKQLKSDVNKEQLKTLVAADARLDLMHFEQVDGDAYDDEEPGGMLDPTTLLMVVDALAELTGGVAVDPAAGLILR